MIDQKQLENVEYFNNLGSKIPNDARCTCAFKSRTAMVKGHSARTKAFLHPKIGFKFKEQAGKELYLEHSHLDN